MNLIALISPDILAKSYIVFVALSMLFLFVLDYLNLSYMRSQGDKVPSIFQKIITVETRRKSMEYTQIKTHFGQIHSISETAIVLIILFSGILAVLDSYLSLSLSAHPITHSVLFILILNFVPGILDLPFQIYDTFHIEGRFGFNKMTFNMFWIDQIKGLIIGLIIGVPFVYGVFAFINFTGDLWWIILFSFIMLFQIIILFVYPVWIAPLFNKFKLLEDGELKDRLENLAKRTNFDISGIFVMDGSSRSSHSNAYFTGFGKFRRVVLFDTLINQLSVDELESVLAHEIGHYKKKHVLKTLFIVSLMLFVGMYALKLMRDWPVMYQAFNVKESNHMALFLFMTLFSTVSLFISPLMSKFSRRNEYQADAFACQACGGSKYLISSLVKLSETNLSNLTPHPWYSTFHNSHPTVVERASAMKKIEVN